MYTCACIKSFSMCVRGGNTMFEFQPCPLKDPADIVLQAPKQLNATIFKC